jgi:hypothetical protein
VTQPVNGNIADLIVEFKQFRDECIWCRNVYLTHKELFGDPNQDETLRKAGALFFYDLSAILQEYHVMVACRLTDPPITSGKSNLTAEYLAGRLVKVGKSSKAIEASLKVIQGYRSKVVGSRNTLVVHRDRETIVRNLGAEDHSPKDVTDFHFVLNQFCDLVAKAVGSQPLDFSSQAGPGDVVDFMRYLGGKAC